MDKSTAKIPPVNYRQRYSQQGLCSTCGRHPPKPERKTCAVCIKAGRDRRRAKPPKRVHGPFLALEMLHASLPADAKLIPDWPHYCIRPDGAVFSCRVRGSHTNRLCPWWQLKVRHWKGYPRVNLYGPVGKRRFLCHKLLMETFVGPCPPRMEIRHLDDNPRNCCLNNLRYGTKAQNRADGIANGILRTGEDSPNANLADAQVREIRRLASEGVTHREIGERFGLRADYISKIVARHIWRHLRDDPTSSRETAFVPGIGQTVSLSESYLLASVTEAGLKSERLCSSIGEVSGAWRDLRHEGKRLVILCVEAWITVLGQVPLPDPATSS